MHRSHLFLKGKHFLLIACNPELIVRWLTSSAVFRSVTTRTVKSVNITECASGYRLEITKGEKVRTQLCIECVSNANVELMRYTEKNNNIGQDQNSTVSLTHSLILTTHAASPPVGGSSHKKNGSEAHSLRDHQEATANKPLRNGLRQALQQRWWRPEDNCLKTVW